MSAHSESASKKKKLPSRSTQGGLGLIGRIMKMAVTAMTTPKIIDSVAPEKDSEPSPPTKAPAVVTVFQYNRQRPIDLFGLLKHERGRHRCHDNQEQAGRSGLVKIDTQHTPATVYKGPRHLAPA